MPLIDKRSKTPTINYAIWDLMYDPYKSTVLCVGVMLYNSIAKQITIAHINDNFCEMESFNTDFQPSWVFDTFKQHLLSNANINHHLKGDHYYGIRSIGASVYLRNENFLSFQKGSSIQSAVERLKENSMISLKDEDITSYVIDGASYDDSIGFPKSSNLDDVMLFETQKKNIEESN